MYWWILRSPPGYPEQKAYCIGSYATQEPESAMSGLEFAASLDDARSLIPGRPTRIDRRPFAQFLELWFVDSSYSEDSQVSA
jgi:hypothetical protein